MRGSSFQVRSTNGSEVFQSPKLGEKQRAAEDKERPFLRYPLNPVGNEFSDQSILFTSQLQDFLDNAPGSSAAAQ